MTLVEQHAAASGAVAAQAFAPGRVNIIGEHTDYNDGLVLPMPLPLGVSLVLGHGTPGRLRARSATFPGVVERGTEERPSGHWSDYLLGCLRIAGIDPARGLDVSVDSTLPVGASVSSSAALCVAALRALRTAFDLSFDDRTSARLAQRVENEFIGLRCGLMDQMVIAVGKPGCAMLFDVQSGETSDHALIPGTTLLTIHSGLTRSLREDAYNDRRASCERAAADMGLPSLRHATLDDLVRVQSSDDRIKARHVIAENDRVRAAVAAMDARDADALGAIMNDGHRSLSADYQVSKPQVDALVHHACAAGALGARMTGAGFGGCIVVLVRTPSAETVTDKVLSAYPAASLIAAQSF